MRARQELRPRAHDRKRPPASLRACGRHRWARLCGHVPAERGKPAPRHDFGVRHSSGRSGSRTSPGSSSMRAPTGTRSKRCSRKAIGCWHRRSWRRWSNDALRGACSASCGLPGRGALRSLPAKRRQRSDWPDVLEHAAVWKAEFARAFLPELLHQSVGIEGRPNLHVIVEIAVDVPRSRPPAPRHPTRRASRGSRPRSQARMRSVQRSSAASEYPLA